ncbi:hypothetical protein ACIREE_41910 [Streptomyces sp. NPDC102467]|uniref:hypothetical protein n=1 Tax=Streptomyces sp. NPDC102467 TaxID=3366179 RepID=UPI00381E2657
MSTPPGRYHVTLSFDGSPALEGWWDNPDTADWKADRLIAEHAENANASVTVTEWDDGREWPLRQWPTPPPGDAERSA